MSLATKVRTKAETQRRDQVNALDERRARHQTEEQLVNAVLHVADKANEKYAESRFQCFVSAYFELKRL